MIEEELDLILKYEPHQMPSLDEKISCIACIVSGRVHRSLDILHQWRNRFIFQTPLILEFQEIYNAPYRNVFFGHREVQSALMHLKQNSVFFYCDELLSLRRNKSTDMKRGVKTEAKTETETETETNAEVLVAEPILSPPSP